MEDGQSEAVGKTEIADRIGSLWSGGKVCDELGVSEGVLNARREEGHLLGPVTGDGVAVYPVAQFQRRDGRVEVKPAIVPLLMALRQFDQWAVAMLLVTPAPELEDLTPLAWLGLGGDPVRLHSLAAAVAREWAAGSGAR